MRKLSFIIALVKPLSMQSVLYQECKNAVNIYFIYFQHKINFSQNKRGNKES